MGLIVLLPVLAIGWLIASSMWTMNMATFHTIDWNSFASIWESLFSGERGLRHQRTELILLLGVVAYVIQLWQWFVYSAGGRTLLRPRRLWGASSCYFGAIIGYMLYICMMNPVVIPTGVWMCIVPGIMLLLTSRLWRDAARARPVE